MPAGERIRKGWKMSRFEDALGEEPPCTLLQETFIRQIRLRDTRRFCANLLAVIVVRAAFATTAGLNAAP